MQVDLLVVVSQSVIKRSAVFASDGRRIFLGVTLKCVRVPACAIT